MCMLFMIKLKECLGSYFVLPSYKCIEIRQLGRNISKTQPKDTIVH